jgi:hypothetical protein
VPALVRRRGRHDDFVAFAGPDLMVTTRTAIRLHRLVRLHVPDVDAIRIVVDERVVSHGEATVDGAARPRGDRWAARIQDAGSVVDSASRAVRTASRSGSCSRRSQAPCHSHAAPQRSHVSNNEPPEHTSAWMGDRSYGH